mmetsp:Transcript_87210/g.279590  ORF Transcript_87210/g.279590 Transcript_87210/m.279590 type:complete len:286 (-) Transcript_87210:10-867(-)
MQMQTLGFRVGQLMAACYRRGLMARSVIRERPALAPHLGACRQLALPPHSGTTRSISTSQASAPFQHLLLHTTGATPLHPLPSMAPGSTAPTCWTTRSTSLAAAWQAPAQPGIGTFPASPSPYHGRYPSASLAFNGTWFYGTYMLDNENHQPGRRLAGTGAAGYCGNWCIQGPFVGFRTSVDRGRSWHEPRLHVDGYAGGLFGESAADNHTAKVKFGAIHVVDLGRELEHAPAADPEPSTPFVYVVGHGASQNSSPESWMQATLRPVGAGSLARAHDLEWSQWHC